MGTIRWWEYEVAGHIVSAAIGKQRRMLVLSWLLMNRKYRAQIPNPWRGATHTQGHLSSSCKSPERPSQVYPDVCLLGGSNLTMKHHTQHPLSSLLASPGGYPMSMVLINAYNLLVSKRHL